MERKSPVNLRISDAALDLIGSAVHEGCVLYAYDDADPKAIKTFITEENAHTVKGTLTIGHGHIRTVVPGMRIDRAEALSLLRSDVREAESCVHRYVKVPLTQGEFDGITDLFFNVGPGRMRGSLGENDPGKNGIACLGKEGGRPSTLLTILNTPQDDGSNYTTAINCFTQWRMPGSIFEWGLLKRRIRFMLWALGLPLTRVENSFPDTIPESESARVAFVQNCLAVAREEKDDIDSLRPRPKPETVVTVIKDTPPASPAQRAGAEEADVGATQPAARQPPPASPKPAAPQPELVLTDPIKLPDEMREEPKPVPVSPGAVPAPSAGVSRPTAPPVIQPPPPPKDPTPANVTDPKDMVLSRRFWGLAATAVSTTHLLPAAWREWMSNEGNRELVTWLIVVALAFGLYKWGQRKATRPLK